MSITSDQPISAGNLKAALDGLTGGGSLLSYKVLLRNDNDYDGKKTFTLQRSVTQYDFLLIVKGAISEYGVYPSSDATIVYHNRANEAWSYSSGSSSSNRQYIKIVGNEWTGEGFSPDPPRLVIGFKL